MFSFINELYLTKVTLKKINDLFLSALEKFIIIEFFVDVLVIYNMIIDIFLLLWAKVQQKAKVELQAIAVLVIYNH